MDIAGLSKLSADTLVLIVSVLGFLVRKPTRTFVAPSLTIHRPSVLLPKNFRLLLIDWEYTSLLSISIILSERKMSTCRRSILMPTTM